MRTQRALIFGVAAVAVGGLLLPPASARPSIGPARFALRAPPGRAPAPTSFSTRGELNGLAATSGHDIWAVGSTRASGPLVLHRGRGAWSAMPVADPAVGNLEGVDATSATNAWAVGNSGDLFTDPTALVLHWDGLSWTPQFNTGAGTLADVAALNDHVAWAVGSTTHRRDLVLRWDGTTWQRLPLSVPGGLVAVAARSAHDVWAVGFDRVLRPQILHWNGRTWKRLRVHVPGAVAGVGAPLFGVAVTPHGRAWAVGDLDCGCGPGPSVVLRWDRKHWRRVPSPSVHGVAALADVTAVGARMAWAVGESGGGEQPTHTVILRRTRHGWKRVPAAPSPGSSPSLRSVVATSSRNAWAVGQTGCRVNHCHTLIEHWNGRRWR